MTDRTGAQTVCRSEGCRRPIRWAHTPNGKRIPLDPDPHPDGNVELDERGIAIVHAQRPLDAGELYMPHHATCAAADEWRRPRPRS